MSKFLVGNGSTINMMPLRMLRALESNIDDLIETEVSLLTFIREISKNIGALPIGITISSKISLYAFFVVDYTANYNILLGRYKFHTNWCVPSCLHQFFFFWKGDETEVVWADKQPFIVASDSVEANYHYKEGPFKVLGMFTGYQVKGNHIRGSSMGNTSRSIFLPYGRCWTLP